MKKKNIDNHFKLFSINQLSEVQICCQVLFSSCDKICTKWFFLRSLSFRYKYNPCLIRKCKKNYQVLPGKTHLFCQIFYNILYTI